MMHNRIFATLQQYPQRFQDIYLTSKKFSEEKHFNLDEVFDQAVKFNDLQYSREQIWGQLEDSQFQGLLKFTSNSSQKPYAVWLLFGETGQGKTTFVNAMHGSEVVEEVGGIYSGTQKTELYSVEQQQLILIDPPGLFDTGNNGNREIANQILDAAKKQLKQNAHIRAIFFVWNPVASMRLRLEKILFTLKNALGEKAIDSVVFLVNKETNRWDQKTEKAYQQFIDLHEKMGLTNPVLLVDLKNMNQEQREQLKNEVERVKPFKEEEFEAHRIKIYYDKFLEVQRQEEESKRQKEEIEKEARSRLEAMMKEEKEKRKEEEKKQGDTKSTQSIIEPINLTEPINTALTILANIFAPRPSANQTVPLRNVHAHPSVIDVVVNPSRNGGGESKENS